jgi:hypothetical protein
MATHSAALLASENAKLRAANKRQKAKRQAKKSYIANGGTLTVAEGTKLIEEQKKREIQSLCMARARQINERHHTVAYAIR